MALPLFLTRSAALKLAKGLSQRDTTIRDFVSGKNLKDTSRFTFKDKMTNEEKLEMVKVVGDEAYMEAVEYFEYNTEGAWMGERTPIFVMMRELLTPIEPIEED